MRTKSIVQAFGIAAVMAVLAWQCTAIGRIPDMLSRAALSDSLVPGAHDEPRAQIAVVGARF